MRGISATLMHRGLAVTGIVWLAVYIAGAVVPIRALPICSPMNFGMCDIQTGSLVTGLAVFPLAPYLALGIVALGALFVMALVVSLRRGRGEFVGLAVLLACSTLIGTGRFLDGYGAVVNPGEFASGWTLLMVIEILAPVLVIVVVIMAAVNRLRNLHTATNALTTRFHPVARR